MSFNLIFVIGLLVILIICMVYIVHLKDQIDHLTSEKGILASRISWLEKKNSLPSSKDTWLSPN